MAEVGKERMAYRVEWKRQAERRPKAARGAPGKTPDRLGMNCQIVSHGPILSKDRKSQSISILKFSQPSSATQLQSLEFSFGFRYWQRPSDNGEWLLQRAHPGLSYLMCQ